MAATKNPRKEWCLVQTALVRERSFTLGEIGGLMGTMVASVRWWYGGFGSYLLSAQKLASTS